MCWRGVPLAFALAACGPAEGNDGGGTTTGVESTSAATQVGLPGDASSSTTNIELSTSTSDGISTDTSPIDSSSAADSSTGDSPVSVCDPQPEMIDVDIDFDIEFPAGDGEIVVDAACVIEAVEQEKSTRLRIELICEEAGEQVVRRVLVTSDPPVALPIAPTDTVQLRVAEVVPVDTGAYECVALHDAEGALVLGQYQTACPTELVDPATWLPPFVLELRMDVCEPEPYEPPKGGSFIQDPCHGQEQRGAFAIGDGVAQELIYDRGSATIGGFDVRVPTAMREFPDDVQFCGEGPFDDARVVFQRAMR